MDLITQSITAIFVATVFFGIVTGIIAILVLSMVGFLKGIHDKSFFKTTTFILIFTVTYIGITTLAPKIKTDSTQSEVQKVEKENYIRDWIFEGESIAIEPADKYRLTKDESVYFVMTEEDNLIYVVTLYGEDAFGLSKYKLEHFNDDVRLLPNE